ncbi:hypothetical protein LSS_22980 [Leptospira santarosai serovar Shermani str. LT 821]|uniref:Uncharacterized protein n=1 Tax=Leptospira santarosai serovar Shermani str. LT 821 TaxID=758847 RepID=A0A097ESZ6_9LEPT|nr:hypothetical protein LSS_22980 [Leptospira santarosai serovar Shermani str. LT 821]
MGIRIKRMEIVYENKKIYESETSYKLLSLIIFSNKLWIRQEIVV